jgi:hypothetical protein
VDRVFLSTLLILLLGAGSIPEVEASADRVPTLVLWYQSVGAPLPGEDFGHFLSRVAQARMGTAYSGASESTVTEELALEIDRFECVSLLESSLAVARCAWRGEPTEGCFVWEILGLRYRSGLMGNLASRLHYFIDWLEDNEGRWRLKNLTAELGGQPLGRDFYYITQHAAMAPALALPGVRRSMAAIERDLSSRQHVVLQRNDVRGALDAMRDGDLIAIVGNKPGRLVMHAGLIARQEGERARLLHASSYHRRVVVTREDVAAYVMRRPERTGVIVARPLPPKKSQ